MFNMISWQKVIKWAGSWKSKAERGCLDYARQPKGGRWQSTRCQMSDVRQQEPIT